MGDWGTKILGMDFIPWFPDWKRSLETKADFRISHNDLAILTFFRNSHGNLSWSNGGFQELEEGVSQTGVLKKFWFTDALVVGETRLFGTFFCGCSQVGIF